MGAQADLVGDASGSAGDTEKVQDVLVPWVLPKRGEPSTAPRTPVGSSGDAVQEPRQGDPDEPHVYHRYYHLFVHGELQELVEEAATYEGFALSQKEEGQGLPPGKKWLRVVDVGWEADNWWLEGEVGVKPA
jgi:tRNA (uracil-5-)-methyltransferase TRM9